MADLRVAARLQSQPRMRKVLKIAALALLFVRCGNIRHDELACEEAAQHLVDCCGQMVTQHLDCVYRPGCEGDDKPPELSIQASQCLFGSTCEELRLAGACTDPKGACQ
jgi:hypothetical protein